MRSYFATLRQLVLPAGSPPGSPAVVIGADMPASLVTFYAAQNRRVVAGTVMRTDAGNYVYDVLVVGSAGVGAPLRAVGAVDSVNGVAEQYKIQFVGAGVRMTSTGEEVLNGPVTFAGSAQFNGPVTFAGSAQFNGTASFTEIRFGSRSQGRGLVAYVDSAANTGFNLAEVTTLTTGNVPMTAGRVYEIRLWGHYSNSGGTVAEAIVRVRQGGPPTGPLLMRGTVQTSAAGLFSTLTVGKVRVDAASLSGPWVATLQESTGPGVLVQAGAGMLRTFEVWDVGAVADFGGIAGNLPLVQP